MTTTTIGFSNETLERLPRVRAGDTLDCLLCGQQHVLEAIRDEQGQEMLFYLCGDKPYLAALRGHLVVGVEVAP